MFGFVRRFILSAASSEVAMLKNRYNSKCTECRSLIEKISLLEEEIEDHLTQKSVVKSHISKLETEITQKDLIIEARDNQIMLTDMVVEQQTQIIKRDLEMRRTEHLDAAVRSHLASVMSGQGIKEETRASNESDINYRPGKQ
jgi:hypothetical protein